MCQIETNRNRIFVRFFNINRLNILNINLIEKQILNSIVLPASAVYIDLANISFIDSTAFNSLVKILNVIHRKRSFLKLINVNAEITELFTLVKLEKTFGLQMFSD